MVKLTTASVALQEISSLGSELVNLEAEIQMQQANMEVKEVVMKKLKEKMDQVAAVCYVLYILTPRSHES